MDEEIDYKDIIGLKNFSFRGIYWLSKILRLEAQFFVILYVTQFSANSKSLLLCTVY